jgi:hypothetical protein
MAEAVGAVSVWDHIYNRRTEKLVQLGLATFCFVSSVAFLGIFLLAIAPMAFAAGFSLGWAGFGVALWKMNFLIGSLMCFFTAAQIGMRHYCTEYDR